MFSKQIDILAIGDTTTDAIIRIKQAHIECNISHKNCELCMKFGDKIPYESLTVIRATGNSANVTVASARLGLNTALISNVGNDLNGQECIETLKKEKVDTKFVSVHKKMETNYHYVLWYDSERTILVKHNEFPYRLPKIANNPKWVYLSSLASNSYEYQKVIIKWLKDNPDIKLAFQPGTFQIELGLEKLKDLYLRSEIFYCNKEEAQKILNTKESDLKKLLNMMRSEGPKIVVITDGENGAYADDGMNAYFMPVYPDKKHALERTGAGDAFSATFTTALALGKSIEEALFWSPINSASVIQEIGAQKGLLSLPEIKKLLSTAPEYYRPKKI